MSKENMILQKTRYFDDTLEDLKRLVVPEGFERDYESVVKQIEYILDDHEGLTKICRELERKIYYYEGKLDCNGIVYIKGEKTDEQG